MILISLIIIFWLHYRLTDTPDQDVATNGKDLDLDLNRIITDPAAKIITDPGAKIITDPEAKIIKDPGAKILNGSQRSHSVPEFAKLSECKILRRPQNVFLPGFMQYGLPCTVQRTWLLSWPACWRSSSPAAADPRRSPAACSPSRCRPRDRTVQGSVSDYPASLLCAICNHRVTRVLALSAFWYFVQQVVPCCLA